MKKEEIKKLLTMLYYSSKNLKSDILISNNEGLLQIIKKNKLVALFNYGMDMVNKETFSAQELEEVKKISIASGIKNIYQDLSFTQIVNKFNEANIPIIVFKGYIVKNIYYKGEMRSMGDIDLIVDKKHFEKAKRIFIDNLSFSYLQEDDDELCLINSNKVVVELHHHLVTELSKNQKYFDDTYPDHLKEENRYFTFDDDYHFIYMIDHMYKHFVEGGLGLKYIYDFALYIEKFPNVIKNCYHELCDLGLDRLVIALLKVCEEYLNMDVKILLSIFSKKISKEVVDTFILSLINNGEYGTLESRMKAKNANNTFFSRLFRRLFPDIYKPKKGSLLKDILFYPFRIIRFWFRFIKKNRSYISATIKHYSNIDSEEKQRLINMYSEIK